MKFVSWNVNGIRAALKKGFMDYYNEIDADIFALQETKANRDQVEIETPNHLQFWNSAEKRGYSGTLIFVKKEPLDVKYGIGIEEHDREGRVITLEYDDFYFVNCYTPNSKRGLERLDYRMLWEDDFRAYLNGLNEKKSVVLCGDLNVAHKEIDLKNPSANHKNAGFTDEERNKFTELLNSGFVDSYRYFYPEREDAYSWWSYFAKSRERNIGWRIDYFVVSEDAKERMQDAQIHSEIMGSDHCPVYLEFK